MDNIKNTDKTSSLEEEWIEISVEIDQHLQDALADFLTELGSNGVIIDEEDLDPLSGKVQNGSNDLKLCRAYLKNGSQLQDKIHSLDRYLKSLARLHSLKDPPPMKLKIIHEEDWSRKWQRFFTTTRVGTHIIVKPTWEIFIPESDDIIIEMDPGMAFGTGTHGTTRMCLKAIEDLMLNDNNRPIKSMLDVGVGSGILSIAAAKLGIEKIVGVDIDPIALRYARQNIEKNHVDDKASIQECSLEKLEGRFDLVVANILSDVLIKLRKDLYRHLTDNGTLILSGILDEDAAKLEKKFKSKKATLEHHYYDTGWICLLFRKQS